MRNMCGDGHPLIRLTRTLHRRFGTTTHEFSYRLPYYWIDLEILPNIRSWSPIISNNLPNFLSIYDRDYLSDGEESIRDKWIRLRSKSSIPLTGTVYLLTMPRCVFPNFNPVSFYYEVDEGGVIRTILAEVTNTYRDKHFILIPGNSNSTYIDNRQSKAFHVSPFQPDDGEYHFRILNSVDRIEIHIRLIRDGKTVFYANLLEEETRFMTTSAIFTNTLRFPLGLVATMPRILYQAGRLYFGKKQPANTRPIPRHPDTIRRRPPTRVESWCVKLVMRRLRSFPVGCLLVTFPTGLAEKIGSDCSNPAEWIVDDYAVFRALVFRGEMGLGETFVDDLWRTPDLSALLTYFLRNRHFLKTQIRGSILSKFAGKVGHWFRRNTLGNSTKNIQAHYDLSNEMYQLFLDDQMNYSSAYFSKSDQSLEAAQLVKLDRLIDALRIQPNHHVLEIGSGWGAAAIRMAQKCRCRVTTLTLSRAQYDYVTARIEALGLANQITVLLEDYRIHSGRYNRILSIEMIEAVGHQYLPTYFRTIDRLLESDGLVAIQAITIPDQRYSDYRKRVDWIQRYIFPGGHLPSLAIIQSVLATHTQLTIDRTENIGPHYAKTLAEWRRRFLSRSCQVQALGFDPFFIRKWVYYFTYCEVGFRNRYINTHQLVLTRPVNNDLIKEDQV
ncbi:DUF1365 family protein [bacterium]|nr:DUF1365 family protein [bacterium]